MGQRGEAKPKLNAKGLRFAIVVSRFNPAITHALLSGARDNLIKHGASEKAISLFWVPGAFEIPRLVKALCESKQYDGILPLGCVIRGETPHFEYISREVSRGLMQLSLEYETPLVFGVLTTDTLAQAEARSGKKSNKGAEVAESLLELIQILKSVSSN
jgi:6,7-dimethyl-8-ribityllumazine synthase